MRAFLCRTSTGHALRWSGTTAKLYDWIMYLTAELRDEIRRHLLAWFALNRRDLPWRSTRDPYRILVAEVMLQQTQVDRVIPYYERWLAEFPTVHDLARAETGDVIRAWAGLGYNRRAVNLQRTARAVVDDHAGVFPADPQSLRSLPGIGHYTAGAIAAFAFEADVVFVDTNMRRVIHRLVFGSDIPVPIASDASVLAAAAELLPEGHGWIWNQALIEFGALHCTRRRPLCVICPLRPECRAVATIQSDIATLPTGARLKNEGTFAGSSRQFRGRIVDALRERHVLSLDQLGARIKPGYDDDQEPWLLELVNGLRRDGLVTLREPGPEWDAGEQPPKPLVMLP